MKRTVLIVGVLALACVYAANAPKAPRPDPLPAPSFEGIEPVAIISVIDADTIRVAGGDVIRLVGIQAPEAGAPHGIQSTNWARNLLGGETVYLIDREPEEDGQLLDGHPVDRYNRRLAFVYRAPDGLFVNLEAIRGGYAESYRRFPCRYTDQFTAWQTHARAHGKGLWRRARMEGGM